MLQKSVYTLGLVLLLFFLPACSGTNMFGENPITGNAISFANTKSSCAETDGGLMPYQYGITKVTTKEYGVVRKKSYADFCSERSVIEYYCEGKSLADTRIPCPQGCHAGECKGRPAEKGVTCKEEWQSDFRCAGGFASEKAYTARDCSTQWRKVKECSNGCNQETGQCIPDAVCTTRGVYQCDGDVQKWGVQAEDCSIAWKNHFPCDNGCNKHTSKCCAVGEQGTGCF